MSEYKTVAGLESPRNKGDIDVSEPNHGQIRLDWRLVPDLKMSGREPSHL